MPESTNAFTCGSSLADKSSFLVEPKLTSFAFFKCNSLFAVSKNSSSFGDAPGQPPSIKLTPRHLLVLQLQFYPLQKEKFLLVGSHLLKLYQICLFS